MVSPKGIVSTAAGVIGVVLPMMIPQISPWIGWPIVGCAIVAILFGLYQIFGLNWLPSRRLLVSEAARLMYNKSGPELREMAQTTAALGPEEMNPAHYFESALTVLGRNGVVTLYGRKSPGLIYEVIPRGYLDAVSRTYNDNFTDYYDKSKIEWWEVRVSRSDAIRGLKEYEVDERRQRLRKT